MTINGRTFASKREAAYAQELERDLKRGKLSTIVYQPVIELTPKPNRITYIPDFRIVWRNGNEEYVEVKGFWTQTAKLKLKLFHHFHPDKKLVIVN